MEVQMKENKKDNSHLKNTLQVLENLIAVDKSNQRLKDMTVEKRTEAEIKDRISSLITESERNIIGANYEELYNTIHAYLSRHDDLRCPFSVYSSLLKRWAIRPTYFGIIALNDGAIYRWKHKEMEWSGFNRFEIIKQITAIKAALSQPLVVERKVTDVFNGGIGVV